MFYIVNMYILLMENNSRKFTTIAVSKDMVKLIGNIVDDSQGLYKTKTEFINAALREKIERVHQHGPYFSKKKKHDPSTI